MEEKKNENLIDTKDVVNKNKKKKSSKSKVIIIVLSIIIALTLISTGIYLFYLKNDNKAVVTESEKKESPYRMKNNSISDFDLTFLKLETGEKNKIYSPLSIKYALAMLAEGANGESKSQITDIIGDYKSTKYTNSEYLSLANAIYIRDSFKESINKEYIDKLSSKYNAEVKYDTFETAGEINSWVSDKTFGLIKDILNDQDISDKNLFLINSLAINMEWNEKIQSTDMLKGYDVRYHHEDYYDGIMRTNGKSFYALDFNNNKKVKSPRIGASLNNYDIISVLGEENIRKTVSEAYEEWYYTTGGCGREFDVDGYLETYMKELASNYKRVDVSTDFEFYNGEDVKVFAKDLKEYDGTTLQYVGIMPKEVALEDFIKNTNAKSINEYLDNLKKPVLENVAEGKVTKIVGYIPLFKFDYELDLLNDLKKIGITNVFSAEKADLSKLTSQKHTFINSANHKATIDFSNDGIKAGATTMIGGTGGAGCYFEYLYDVPVEVIDLTFDKPYLFLIRDKKTGEIWFTGSVYEPTMADELDARITND